MSDDTLQLALEALEASIDDVRDCLDNLLPPSSWGPDKQRVAAYQAQIERHELAIEGLKGMIAERALQAMADNARELGLTYDASVVRIDTSAERVEKEAAIKHMPTPPECQTEAEKKAYAFGWYKALEWVGRLTIAQAVQTVIKAMQDDPEYAWSWHCNIAMAFVGAGGDRYTANQGAARFLELFAKVQPAHELPTQPAPAQPLPLDKDGWWWVSEDECISGDIVRKVEAAHHIGTKGGA